MYKSRGFGSLIAILGLTVTAALSCIAASNETAAPKVKGVSFTITAAVYKDGKVTATQTLKGCSLLPDKIRTDTDEILSIRNADENWQYMKRSNTYRHTKLTNGQSIDFGERLNANTAADQFRRVGMTLTEKKTKGTLDGVECPMIEIDVPYYERGQVKVGPAHIVEYLDPKTNLVKQIMTEMLDPNSKKVISRSIIKYDYAAIPTEDQFVFTPPAGAKPTPDSDK